MEDMEDLTIDDLDWLIYRFKWDELSVEELAFLQTTIKTEPGKTMFEKAMDPAKIEAERKVGEKYSEEECDRFMDRLDKACPGWSQRVLPVLRRLREQSIREDQQPSDWTIGDLLRDNRGTIVVRLNEYLKNRHLVKALIIRKVKSLFTSFLKKIWIF